MKRPSSRQVVQIAVSPGGNSEDDNDLLYALCDDGTIWWCECTTESEWEKINDVPQE